MDDSLRSQPEAVQPPARQTEAGREGRQGLASGSAGGTQTLYLGE
jgi:hypothetical protein